MSLMLNTRKVNGHIIIEALGRIEFGPSSQQLRDLANRLTAEGGRKIILNMTGITYMDSAGLGLLLSIYATIRNQGGELKLLNVGPRVRELLKTTRLLEVFDMFEDESQAIGHGRTVD